MSISPKISLFPVLITLASQCVFAQSTLSVPSPLMKPQSFASQKGQDGGGQHGGQPGGQDNRQVESQPPGLIPPLPAAIRETGVVERGTGKKSSKSEDIIHDTLASFKVTAIVGDRASLRNNVGASQPATSSLTQPQQNNQPWMGQPNQALNQPVGGTQPTAHQTVVRVKTGVPVYVAGIELIPTVLEAGVDFRLGGHREIVASVILESLSTYGYVPVASSKDAPDPAVTTRVNPAVNLNGSSGNSTGKQGNSVSGGSGGSNGINNPFAAPL